MPALHKPHNSNETFRSQVDAPCDLTQIIRFARGLSILMTWVYQFTCIQHVYSAITDYWSVKSRRNKQHIASLIAICKWFSKGCFKLVRGQLVNIWCNKYLSEHDFFSSIWIIFHNLICISICFIFCTCGNNLSTIRLAYWACANLLFSPFNHEASQFEFPDTRVYLL